MPHALLFAQHLLADSAPAVTVPPAPAMSTGSLAAFGVIVAVVVLAVWLGLRAAASSASRGRWAAVSALALLAWVGLWSALALAGFWRGDGEATPRIMLFFGGSNLTAVAVSLSPAGRRLATSLPLAALVGFQAFRLPLELVLHQWASEGAIPWSMTFAGQNFDIATGAAAVLLGLWLAKGRPPRAALWAFQALGLGMLGVIAFTALRATPGPAYVPSDAVPLLLGYDFPTTLIVPVCVAGALAGHVVLFRAMRAQKA